MVKKFYAVTFWKPGGMPETNLVMAQTPEAVEQAYAGYASVCVQWARKTEVEQCWNREVACYNLKADGALVPVGGKPAEESA